MSKELEALERFNNVAFVYNEYNYECFELYRRNIENIDKDYDLLKQALKRNEPVKYQTETYTNGFFKSYACPVCDNNIQREFDYCPYCGQKLDWSE